MAASTASDVARRRVIGLARTAFSVVRNVYLFRVRYRWVKVGTSVSCQLSCRIRIHNHVMTIGDRTGIGHDCLFHAETHLGADVLIGSQSAFLNRDEHDIHTVGKLIAMVLGDRSGQIVVEDDVWVGYGCIVLAPVHLGRGCVVGAGSVVTKDVEPYAVVVGIPARKVGTRFSEDQISRHEAILNDGPTRSLT